MYVNILIQVQSDMYGQGNHPGIILRSLFSAAVIPVSSWSRRLPRRKRQHFAKKLRQRSHHPIEMWPTRMNHPSGHLQACEAHLGAKNAPGGEKLSKTRPVDHLSTPPPRGPCWDQDFIENRSGGILKSGNFFDWL